MGSFWDQRWSDIEAELHTVVWSDFRQSPIVKHLQTYPAKLQEWLDICVSDGVPLEWGADSIFGNPIGESIDGHFFTASSLRHAHQAHRILTRWTPEDRPITVVEVGAGYGGFPRLFSRLIGPGAYYLVDAEPILKIQERYLKETSEFGRFAFLQPGEPWPHCDLVLNSNSFAEMDSSEVDWYFEQIQTVLADGGWLYLTNRVDHTTSFRRYPYDAHWHHEVDYLLGDMWVECFSKRDLLAESAHPSKRT